MATVAEALNTALQYHQAGQLPQAEAIYRQILNVQPTHAAALNLIGTLCLQQRRIAEAIDLLEQAAVVAPDNADGLNNLGGAYQAAERWQNSVAVLQRALTLAPDNPKFHFDLGNAFKALKQHQQAIDCFETAIRLNPVFIQAIHNLGTTLTAVGRLDEAIQQLRTALKIRPDYANAQNALGNALLDSGRAEEAVSWLQQAVAQKPGEARFCCNLGVAQKAVGDPEAAYQSYSRALQLQPDMLEARKNLGNLFVSQQRTADAVREFEAASALAPDDVEMLLAIGDGCRDLEDFNRAESVYSRAAAKQPEDALLAIRKAFLCPSVFSSIREIREYRRALHQRVSDCPAVRLRPADVESRGLMPPFGLTYHGLNDRPVREAIASLYQSSFSEPGFADRQPSATKTIIGFVVTNGHEGIFARCMSGLLDRLDRTRFDVWVVAPAVAAAFLRGKLSNDQTGYLTLPDRFHRMIAPLQQLQPDLLYFWECGTDLLNYFLPLARLAPVQCTGWGLPVTSGIPAMDYFLSSSLVEPPDAAEHYSEQLLLADTFLTWQEPIDLPPTMKSRSDFGFRTDQHLYLCAQNLMKIHPDFDSLLAGILRQDPAGCLVLLEDRNDRLKLMLQQRFRVTCPDVENRIRFLPRLSFEDYLSLVAAADVALDPLHYGSGITAHEIFCCGTPLITLPTSFRRGRFVAGCYRKMELEGGVAESPEDYIRRACELASTPDRRSELSAQIRDRRHLLFKDTAAVAAFETCLEQMTG
ncbi:MAG: tetratricopeptide repeat protein [Fuerstiella sp.]